MDRRIKAVTFDFDGVLCRGRFYEPMLSSEFPTVAGWLRKNFFLSGNEILSKWMRGQVSCHDVHAYLGKETHIPAEAFDRMMTESLRSFALDAALLEWNARLRAVGIRTAVVTDNMDVFSHVLVPMHGLDLKFDAVLNSSDCGRLKGDQAGLFHEALRRLGVRVSETLHIDDSGSKIDFFRSLGGHAYHLTPDGFPRLDRELAEVMVSAAHDQDLLRLHHDEFQGRALHRGDE